MNRIERSLSQDKKEAKIATGQEILGRKKVNLGEIDTGDVLSFIYKAETSGFPKSSMDYGKFDLNPQIIVLAVKRNRKTGKYYIDGLNVNYTDKRVDRGRVILTEKANIRVNRNLYETLIHRYSLERVKSSIYKSNDWAVDAALMNSVGDFVRVD